MEFVEIDKKKYPVAFNMAALMEAQDTLEISISAILTQFDTLTQNQLMKLYYLGLKYGADEFDRKCSITYSAFVDYSFSHREILEKIAEIIMKDILSTLQVMNEQTKMINEANSEGEVTKKKKKPSGVTTSD